MAHNNAAITLQAEIFVQLLGKLACQSDFPPDYPEISPFARDQDTVFHQDMLESSAQALRGQVGGTIRQRGNFKFASSPLRPRTVTINPSSNIRIFSPATTNNSSDIHRYTKSSRKPAKLFRNELSHTASLRGWCAALVIGHQLSHYDHFSVKVTPCKYENFLQRYA